MEEYIIGLGKGFFLDKTEVYRKFVEDAYLEILSMDFNFFWHQSKLIFKFHFLQSF